MFQESSHDTAHDDVFADPANPRTQRTHAAHIEVNLDAFLGSPIQSLDHVLVQEGIHFGDDTRRTPSSRVIRFALDKR